MLGSSGSAGDHDHPRGLVLSHPDGHRSRTQEERLSRGRERGFPRGNGSAYHPSMTGDQKKKADGRYAGTNYRYSDRFIKVLTGCLIAWIFVGTGLGFALGALGDVFFRSEYGPQTPDWYNLMAAVIAASGVALPLIVAAVLGALAINRYAAPVAVLLLAAIGAFVYGRLVDGQGIWMLYGIAGGVLAVALFFSIGFQARVPIWLQLPMLNSPRVYLTRGDTEDAKPPRE